MKFCSSDKHYTTALAPVHRLELCLVSHSRAEENERRLDPNSCMWISRLSPLYG